MYLNSWYSGILFFSEETWTCNAQKVYSCGHKTTQFYLYCLWKEVSVQGNIKHKYFFEKKQNKEKLTAK